MGYTPNYSHLVGIMIINHWVQGYTIFRQTQVQSGSMKPKGPKACMSTPYWIIIESWKDWCQPARFKSWYQAAYLMNLKFEAIHYSVNSKVKLIRFSHHFAVRILHKNHQPRTKLAFQWGKNTSVRNHQQTMELFQRDDGSTKALTLPADPSQLLPSPAGCSCRTHWMCQGHLVIPTGFQKKTGYPLVNVNRKLWKDPPCWCIYVYICVYIYMYSITHNPWLIHYI